MAAGALGCSQIGCQFGAIRCGPRCAYYYATSARTRTVLAYCTRSTTVYSISICAQCRQRTNGTRGLRAVRTSVAGVSRAILAWTVASGAARARRSAIVVTAFGSRGLSRYSHALALLLAPADPFGRPRLLSFGSLGTWNSSRNT